MPPGVWEGMGDGRMEGDRVGDTPMACVYEVIGMIDVRDGMRLCLCDASYSSLWCHSGCATFSGSNFHLQKCVVYVKMSEMQKKRDKIDPYFAGR